VIASGDYAESKPSPDPYLRAAEVLGVASADCLALEDSHAGVQAAAAAGIRTVMVPDLLPATEDVRRLCEWVARDLHEVRARLG
jgi:beta-phosphoglucomutase-like phosphatase (HAD superfamily)